MTRATTHPRVLVVEDEPDIRDGLADVFLEEGYAVDAASNGAEALDVARVRPPDLIVLDLTMPVMDGLTFLEHLRGDPAIASVPVVILTARREVPVRGCTIVHKPFDIDPLLAAAARCLAEKAARASAGL